AGLGLRERLLRLGDGEGALEALDDLAVAVDREEPGLGGYAERRGLGAQALIDAVLLVDLVVDERDVVLAVLRADLLEDVDDRAADAAGAQRRRREQQQYGLLAVDVREVRLEQTVGGRVARGDARCDAADALEGRRVDLRRRVSGAGRLGAR